MIAWLWMNGDLSLVLFQMKLHYTGKAEIGEMIKSVELKLDARMTWKKTF